MKKETWKTFSFLAGLFLVLLMGLQEAHASSSPITASDYPRMTAAVHQDINAGSQMGGNYFDSSHNATDRFHSILATPVPELIAMLLLSFVLNGLWGGTRKIWRN